MFCGIWLGIYLFSFLPIPSRLSWTSFVGITVLFDGRLVFFLVVNVLRRWLYQNVECWWLYINMHFRGSWGWGIFLGVYVAFWFLFIILKKSCKNNNEQTDLDDLNNGSSLIFFLILFWCDRKREWRFRVKGRKRRRCAKRGIHRVTLE